MTGGQKVNDIICLFEYLCQMKQVFFGGYRIAFNLYIVILKLTLYLCCNSYTLSVIVLVNPLTTANDKCAISFLRFFRGK